ncbi:glycosyltransferase family 2 protein [Bacteroidota bacterium]
MINNKIVIITLNYNQNRYTLNCINSILKSSYDDFQIILVDNGSTNMNYHELENLLPKDSRILLRRIDQNRGYVGGINFGLNEGSKLNPDFYVIMNNDTLIDSNAIEELISTAEKYQQKAIVAGKVYHLDDPNIIQQTGTLFTDLRYLKGYSPGKNEKDIGQCEEESERDSLDDILWVLPKEIFHELGYYCDYYFMYAEQGDYAQHARRKGYKLIYTPKVKIWHKGSATSGKGDRRALPICYWQAKSSFIFTYRNLKFKYFMIRNFILFFKMIAKMIVFKGEEKKRTISSFRGYLAGIKWIINKKADTGYNPYINK